MQQDAPQRPQPAPPPKPDPVTILQQQLERLKRIDDNLNFIKSFIIIITILYVLDALFTFVMSILS